MIIEMHDNIRMMLKRLFKEAEMLTKVEEWQIVKIHQKLQPR